MENFFHVYERLKRQGPGSERSTLSVFELIPGKEKIKNRSGCGMRQGNRQPGAGKKQQCPNHIGGQSPAIPGSPEGRGPAFGI